MPSNFLNYTNLSYNEIKSDIISRLSQDSRFANFTESQLYAVMMEIFSATTDFNNYYIERRAEESYPDSAKLRSSIIRLSKMLGYVVRRPIPATTSIKITLKSLPTGASAGQTIQFKKFTPFTFNGMSFVLKDGLTYTLTQADVNNFADPNYFKVLEFYSSEPNKAYEIFESQLIPDEFKQPITLFQAEFKTYAVPNTSTQADQRFQTYKINDKEFSNLYGQEDFGFDVTTGDIDVIENVTRVAVGSDESSAFCNDMSEFDAKNEFIIDRRSFLNDYTIPLLTAAEAGKTVKYCVIKTNADDTVELKFGDDVVSSIGAKGLNNVYVKYLSTKGADGNFVGVIGKRIECQSDTFGNNFTTENFLFELRRNVVGGANIEEIDSIKINSPEIFYSLDRCVTPRDYINFLRTLTISGKQIKNAIVWGEQEETRDNIYKIANIKLFNVVLFCVLADMYVKSNGVYTGLEDLDTIILDTNNLNDYYSLMVLSDSVTPLQTIDTTNEELVSIYKKLYSRSEITVKNIYVSPVVHDFKIDGNIYLNPLVDKQRTVSKVNNAIYEYLSKNADFNTPIYLSNIIDIVEDFPEVHHADIYFSSLKDDTLNYLYTTNTGSEVEEISAAFPSAPIGYVFFSNISATDKCGTREYSTTTFDTSFEFYQKTLFPLLSAYSENTRNAIACLMPKLQMRISKLNGTQAITELIWPSENSIDKNTCSLPTSNSTSVDSNFTPSERNLYLGLLSCFYNNLKKIIQRDPTIALDTKSMALTQELEDFFYQQENCFCSLKKLNKITKDPGTTTLCYQYINNALPSEIKKFVDTDILNVVNIFRNSLITDIKTGLLDSHGNIVNFSMKNEIARIQAPDSSQYLYR